MREEKSKPLCYRFRNNRSVVLSNPFLFRIVLNSSGYRPMFSRCRSGRRRKALHRPDSDDRGPHMRAARRSTYHSLPQTRKTERSDEHSNELFGIASHRRNVHMVVRSHAVRGIGSEVVSPKHIKTATRFDWGSFPYHPSTSLLPSQTSPRKHSTRPWSITSPLPSRPLLLLKKRLRPR